MQFARKTHDGGRQEEDGAIVVDHSSILLQNLLLQIVLSSTGDKKNPDGKSMPEEVEGKVSLAVRSLVSTSSPGLANSTILGYSLILSSGTTRKLINILAMMS